MRLVLAPKILDDFSNHEVQNWAKNTSKKLENEKRFSSPKEMYQPIKTAILMQIKSLQGVEIIQKSSRSLENWGDLLLLSSLL
jgi:hypothetical protein